MIRIVVIYRLRTRRPWRPPSPYARACPALLCLLSHTIATLVQAMPISLSVDASDDAIWQSYVGGVVTGHCSNCKVRYAPARTSLSRYTPTRTPLAFVYFLRATAAEPWLPRPRCGRRGLRHRPPERRLLARQGMHALHDITSHSPSVVCMACRTRGAPTGESAATSDWRGAPTTTPTASVASRSTTRRVPGS